MKMIEVLDLMAKGEIKEGTILKFVDSCNEIVSYIYDEEMNAFYDEAQYDLGSEGEICGPFLNKKVELIPPKEKKYLVKFNMRWLRSDIGETRYLNYVKKYEYVHIAGKAQNLSHKTQFTKQELQSIQPVREFLEDMEGKYELIEVEENE